MPLAVTFEGRRKMPESINLTPVEIIKIERANKGTLERKASFRIGHSSLGFFLRQGRRLITYGY